MDTQPDPISPDAPRHTPDRSDSLDCRHDRGRSIPAATSTDVAQVGRALRTDPVFVEPDAERALSEDEAESLRSAIMSAGTPIFVAVLPQSVLDVAGGDPAVLTSDVAAATDLAGTYAVLAGDSFRAGSTWLPSGEAGRLASAAFQAHASEGPAAVLRDFVERVGGAASEAGTEGGLPDQRGSASSDGDGGGRWLSPGAADRRRRPPGSVGMAPPSAWQGGPAARPPARGSRPADAAGGALGAGRRRPAPRGRRGAAPGSRRGLRGGRQPVQGRECGAGLRRRTDRPRAGAAGDR